MVELLLDEETKDRWSSLTDALVDFGIRVSDRAGDDDNRSAMLKHLLSLACGDAPRGFWTENDFVRLDSGDRCGPLSGDPEVVAVEQENVFESPGDAFEAVRKRCEAGSAVSLQQRDGPDLRIVCDRTLHPPAVFRLEAAPTLAIPAPSEAG